MAPDDTEADQQIEEKGIPFPMEEMPLLLLLSGAVSVLLTEKLPRDEVGKVLDAARGILHGGSGFAQKQLQAAGQMVLRAARTDLPPGSGVRFTGAILGISDDPGPAGKLDS
jgi:hypothetical protein